MGSDVNGSVDVDDGDARSCKDRMACMQFLILSKVTLSHSSRVFDERVDRHTDIFADVSSIFAWSWTVWLADR